MSNFKPNYFQRRSKPQGPKANERIRALDVQVIGSDGGNLGAMPLNKAIEIAKNEGLDLIEISPNANPPVCKIMDIGKYKYDMQKKASKAKKNQKTAALKELKLRPGTEIHDYNFKIKNAPIKPGIIKFINQSPKLDARINSCSLTEKAPIKNNAGEQCGEITSGSFSPTTNRSIAVGYVERKRLDSKENPWVTVRGKDIEATQVSLPFVPHRYFRK